jgi:hypothetical protein
MRGRIEPSLDRSAGAGVLALVRLLMRGRIEPSLDLMLRLDLLGPRSQRPSVEDIKTSTCPGRQA